MQFTHQIAHYIKEQELELDKLTIILPSERAKNYIAASLFETFGGALLSPKITTIDRWVSSLSPKAIIDKTRALVQLYAVHEKIKEAHPSENEIADSFDAFLSWGYLLLSDFDELDRYLLDAKQVFKNLSEIKEMEAWQVDEKDLSESQRKFLRFWEQLPDYYFSFQERLKKSNVDYTGKAYRFVAENIALSFQENEDGIFLFAGFNALSKAELSIIKQLHTMGRGHVLINANTFYYNNPTHEAGRFLRNLSHSLDKKELPFIGRNMTEEKKKITVVECAQITGQVKVAATRLLELSGPEIDKTLILLADETLITPLLKNIPKKVEKANITLGLPLRSTALKTWADILFSFQENKTHFATEALYHKTVKQFLKHPFIQAILSQKQKNKVYELEKKIVRYNKIFVHQKTVSLGGVLDEVVDLICTSWGKNWELAVKNIRAINRKLFPLFREKSNFEKALVDSFDKALVDFQNIAGEGLPEMELRSFKSIFNQHWAKKSIAYHGNPRSGLQVMGLLETRLLDFKRIICIGMNEGNLPPTNPTQSMLPVDLRKYLELPTPREKQGLFAHHFYRLMHHCEELLATYTSAKESIGSNEQSRYLLQLELEFARTHPQVEFKRMHYSIPMEEQVQTDKQVEKTQEVQDRMDARFAKSTSASMLKNFHRCPLDFYYKYILEFGESDEVEESIESSTFGSFVHEVLENFFHDFARRNEESPFSLKEKQPTNVSSKDIDAMLQQYAGKLSEKFLVHFGEKKVADLTGKNLLAYEMACHVTKNFLEKQKQLVQEQQLFIEAVEITLAHELEVEVNDRKIQLHLKGIIDRVDSVDGKIRIVDYKSGKAKGDDAKITQPNDEKTLLDRVLEKNHSLQLLMYAYLYKQNFHQLPDEVGIYSLINQSGGLIGLQIYKEENLEGLVNQFPEILQSLIQRIYDEGEPIKHNSSNYFNFCDYCA